jgi:hypothetical protein
METSNESQQNKQAFKNKKDTVKLVVKGTKMGPIENETLKISIKAVTSIPKSDMFLTSVTGQEMISEMEARVVKALDIAKCKFEYKEIIEPGFDKEIAIAE